MEWADAGIQVDPMFTSDDVDYGAYSFTAFMVELGGGDGGGRFPVIGSCIVKGVR